MLPVWNYVHASAIGTSHADRGEQCQDSSAVDVLEVGGEAILVLTCSDGAGSCPRSGEGSFLACTTFIDIVRRELLSGLVVNSIDREKLVTWIRDVRDTLQARATAHGVLIGEYSCTLLTALLSESQSCFCQIGDGAIVADNESTYEAVFWPQSGEYANVTNFLTGKDFEQNLAVRVDKRNVRDVALLSDGLQPLALHYASKSVHGQFFEPMFHHLREAQNGGDLTEQLKQFLSSKPVNDRTDDDKTLVLASRVVS
jgi:hypothetical protein